MRIYLAAPLFNEMERERNARLAEKLRAWGHEVYLPQEDGGIAYELIQKGGDAAEVRKGIFEGDISAIREADAVLALLDGRVPDEGLCVELGYAYGIGKPCMGYQTDRRTLDQFGNNPMIDGCLRALARTEEDLESALELLSWNRL